MEQPVEHGRGNSAVVVEDRSPVLEGLVGRQDDGAAFIALADDLKEQVGSSLIDGQIAELIEDQKPRAEIFFEFAFECSCLLSRGEIVDDANGVGKEHGMAFQTGRVTQGSGQVRFSDTDAIQKDDVGLLLNEIQAEEILDLESVDFFGPLPSELFESLDDGKASGLDPPLDAALLAFIEFALDEPAQVMEMIPVLLSGLLGPG